LLLDLHSLGGKVMSNARAQQIQAALPADCKLTDRQMRELGRMLDAAGDGAPRGAVDATRAGLVALCAPLAEQAARNIGKWGGQDLATLALVLSEESGEVSKAVLQYAHEDKPFLRIRAEAVDAGAVCVQILKHFRDLET